METGLFGLGNPFVSVLGWDGSRPCVNLIANHPRTMPQYIDSTEYVTDIY